MTQKYVPIGLWTFLLSISLFSGDTARCDAFGDAVLQELRGLKSSYAPIYRDQSKARLIEMGSDVLPYLIPAVNF